MKKSLAEDRNRLRTDGELMMGTMRGLGSGCEKATRGLSYYIYRCECMRKERKSKHRTGMTNCCFGPLYI